MDDLQDDNDSDKDGGSAGAGFRPELIKSYLGFARRALATHKLRALLVFAVGATLTVLAAKYLPRTYSCTTVMMVQGQTVLDGGDASNALAGAQDLIGRRENLEALIRDTGLLRTADARRPPLLRLKDRIITSLFGKMDDKTHMAVLVGTLEGKISVSTEKGDLSIKVSWSDPVTAASLAEAARESFLKARHSAEVSAFEDKMAILDGHATELRDTIGNLLQQFKAARDEQLNRERQARNAARSAANASGPIIAAPAVAPRRTLEPDAQLPALKEKLSALRTKLAAMQAERERRVRDEQAKYDDLKLHLTSVHPSVVTQRERVAIASQISSDESLTQSEIKDIEGEIQQREGMRRQASDFGVGGGSKRANGAEPLPLEVTDMLARDDLDPALSAQLSGAVTKYGSLRNEVFSTRVALDTAQAAFNHRYQVIVPAEVPVRADKPKISVVVGGGLVFSLLLALLLPILAELRADVIRDRWQVEHLQLPVLAELRLPPHSSD